MLSGNKGEWSEVYTFLKLLGDGVLYAADADLKKIEDIYYPIIKIIKNHSETSTEYVRNGEIKLIDGNDNRIMATIPIKTFLDNAQIILNKIKESSGAFSIIELDDFLKQIHVNTLTAPANDKADIILVVHDLNTGLEPTLGFSIKSRLGSPSTLLNASQATNFNYLISGCFSEADMKRINSINTRSKVKDRLHAIESLGNKLEFQDTEEEIFSLNLQLIDSNLPLILSELLIKYYRGEGTDLAALLALIEQDNPCKYVNTFKHSFYSYKVKAFLTDVALGMKPKTVWDGKYDATGGYIIVREDGELICYHLYNRNEFSEYLLRNTKLETPSTTRHKFGSIVHRQKDNKFFFKLNVQIRFKA